jgi:hypothetical protein
LLPTLPALHQVQQLNVCFVSSFFSRQQLDAWTIPFAKQQLGTRPESVTVFFSQQQLGGRTGNFLFATTAGRTGNFLFATKAGSAKASQFSVRNNQLNKTTDNKSDRKKIAIVTIRRHSNGRKIRNGNRD